MPRASGVLGYTSMTDNRSLTGLGGATYNQGPLLRRFAMRGLEVSDESEVLESNSLGTRDFASEWHAANSFPYSMVNIDVF